MTKNQWLRKGFVTIFLKSSEDYIVKAELRSEKVIDICRKIRKLLFLWTVNFRKNCKAFLTQHLTQLQLNQQCLIIKQHFIAIISLFLFATCCQLQVFKIGFT